MHETATVDLTFLTRQLGAIQAGQRELLGEVAEIRRLVLLLSEKAQRTDRNIGEVKDDLQILLKSELGGALANLTNRIENRLAEFEMKLIAELAPDRMHPTPDL